MTLDIWVKRTTLS